MKSQVKATRLFFCMAVCLIDQCGITSSYSLRTTGNLLHNHIAGSKLVTILAVGHTLVMENPAEFNTLVDQFLRE